MTEQDYETVKTELLMVLQNTPSERVKLQAAELLLTLQDRIDNSRWDPWASPVQPGVNRESTG